MIGYLEGEVLQAYENTVLLQTSGGVGYTVQIPLTLAHQMEVGERQQLFIHTSVREDEISLYGFAELPDKQLFERLLKASGVGPKLAITMLTALPVRQLVQAILHEDVHTLSTVPGIGKKTAARLCLELKESLTKTPLTGVGRIPNGNSSVPNTTPRAPMGEAASLHSALKNMGFADKEIMTALAQLPASAETFEEKLRLTLGLLAKS